MSTGSGIGGILEGLYATIDSRKTADPQESYTAKLFARGIEKIAQKTGEEAVEAVIAAVGQGREELIAESADLLYHLMVMWSARDVTPADVAAELARRHGTSGLEERKKRQGGAAAASQG